jgi:phage terminase large subunit GpA-like protein
VRKILYVIGGLVLTAGADVQKDRIDVDVWAWGKGLESWLIDHIVIEGAPRRQTSWSELDAVLNRTWRHETAADLRIQKLAIDMGYEAPERSSFERQWP